jgi:hypothetical protein
MAAGDLTVIVGRNKRAESLIIPDVYGAVTEDSQSDNAGGLDVVNTPVSDYVVQIDQTISGYNGPPLGKGVPYTYTGRMVGGVLVNGRQTDLVSPNSVPDTIAPPGYSVYVDEGVLSGTQSTFTDTGYKFYKYINTNKTEWSSPQQAVFNINNISGPNVPLTRATWKGYDPLLSVPDKINPQSNYLFLSQFDFPPDQLDKVAGKTLKTIAVKVYGNVDSTGCLLYSLGLVGMGEIIRPYGPVLDMDLYRGDLEPPLDAPHGSLVIRPEGSLFFSSPEFIAASKCSKEYSSWAEANNKKLVIDRNLVQSPIAIYRLNNGSVGLQSDSAAYLGQWEPGSNIGIFAAPIFMGDPYTYFKLPKNLNIAGIALFLQVAAGTHEIYYAKLELGFEDGPPIITAPSITPNGPQYPIGSGAVVSQGDNSTNTVSAISITPNGQSGVFGPGISVTVGQQASTSIAVSGGLFGGGNTFGEPTLILSILPPILPSCMGRPRVSLVSVWGTAIIGRCRDWGDLPLENPNSGDCGCNG